VLFVRWLFISIFFNLYSLYGVFLSMKHNGWAKHRKGVLTSNRSNVSKNLIKPPKLSCYLSTPYGV